jgi:hypothetical protein
MIPLLCRIQAFDCVAALFSFVVFAGTAIAQPTESKALTVQRKLWTSTAADPLLSLNDDPAKQAILAFVAQVTKEGSPTFVPPAEGCGHHAQRVMLRGYES